MTPMSYERLVGYQNRDVRNTNIPETTSQSSEDPCLYLKVQDDGRNITQSAPTNDQILNFFGFSDGNSLPFLVPLNNATQDYYEIDSDNLPNYVYQLSGVSGDPDYPTANQADGFFVDDFVEIYLNGSLHSIGGPGLVNVSITAKPGDTIEVRLINNSGLTRGCSEIRLWFVGLIEGSSYSQVIHAKYPPESGGLGQFSVNSGVIGIPLRSWSGHEGELVATLDLVWQHKDCCQDDWEAI